ncbi:Alcohol dehydrogenase [Saitoella coloradoensis]
MPTADSNIQVAEGAEIPKTARAAVYSKIGDCKIDIVDQQVPTPGPNEVLVKLDYSGVCHSDLHLMLGEWPWWPMTDGQVGGHEGVGTILAAHSSVSDKMLGQRVGIKWIASACLSCAHCLSGRDAFCGGQKASGCSGPMGCPGTFQDYVVTDARYCTPIPRDLDGSLAAPLLCAGVTVYKALKILNLAHSSWVAIPGAGGGLGHLGIQYAHALGYRVIAIDAGSKRQLCEGLGAEAFIDFAEAGDELPKRVQDLTDGEGAHAVVVVNASPKSYASAPDLLRIGGQLVCVGIPGGPAPMTLDARNIILKDLNVKGSAVGTRQDAIEALEIAGRGLVKTKVETVGLDGVQGVFEKMRKGEIEGRMVVDLRK